jgi:hypothetical protein
MGGGAEEKFITMGNIIEKIIAAIKIEDVIKVSDFKSEFNAVMKEIHPDVCNLPDAPSAAAKMNHWRDEYENGREYKDDIGVFRTNGYWAEFKSSEKNFMWSVENYRLFMDLKGSTNEYFKKYIPPVGRLLSDGTFRFEFEKRTIPLSGLRLPQEHVNWVLNRLLEYCSFFSEIGFSHAGLTPESVFIVPETHGIQICSFYHLTRIGNQVKTISGKYKNWYPQDLFSTKRATEVIDIELSKKIACYLLGEPSGSAIKLRKTSNEDFVNFLVSQHEYSYPTLSTYKDLLKKNFKKEFHSLTI